MTPASARRVPRSTATPCRVIGASIAPAWLGGPERATGGGGGGGSGSSRCSITKLIVVSTAIGAGWPSISAGSNTYCIAAATAASSKPSPTGSSTSTELTVPVASMWIRTRTLASLPASSAAGGYSGASACTSLGGLVTTPVRLGGGGASGPRTSSPRAVAHHIAITAIAQTHRRMAEI